MTQINGPDKYPKTSNSVKSNNCLTMIIRITNALSKHLDPMISLRQKNAKCFFESGYVERLESSSLLYPSSKQYTRLSPSRREKDLPSFILDSGSIELAFD